MLCLGRGGGRAWRDRDKLLMEMVHEKWGGLTGYGHDIDPNADLLMVVDAYNEKKQLLHQRGPQASLVNEIVRYFGASIPSVVLQTAASPKVALEVATGWSSCLNAALNSALAGRFVDEMLVGFDICMHIHCKNTLYRVIHICICSIYIQVYLYLHTYILITHVWHACIYTYIIIVTYCKIIHTSIHTYRDTYMHTHTHIHDSWYFLY